jgi:AcrR family transcriptional regulator
MARRKLSETSHPDETLTDEHWLRFGDDPQPPMRLKILYVTFDEIAKSGPISFNVASVCDRLGITYPMVNHYFGGRDGLVAEAAHMVYDRYVDNLWKAVNQAPKNPLDRLGAWIRAEIAETQEMGGWGAVLNYPQAAKDVTHHISHSFGEAMTESFELNLARLGSLVRDIRQGSVSDARLERGKVPRAELLMDPELQALVPTVSWATLGVSVWMAGQHLPSRSIPEIRPMLGKLIDNHIGLMITMIESYGD